MTIKSDVNLKGAFSGEQTRQETQAAEVPQSIKNHAPAPTLKPDGSWKARAQEIDRRVREQQEAQKAKNEWASRAKAVQKPPVGHAFRTSARGSTA